MNITAPIELQKTAYYAGAGKSNAEGFGLLEIDKNELSDKRDKNEQ